MDIACDTPEPHVFSRDEDWKQTLFILRDSRGKTVAECFSEEMCYREADWCDLVPPYTIERDQRGTLSGCYGRPMRYVRPWSEKKIEEFRAMYMAGTPWREIEDYFDSSSTALMARCRLMGLPKRSEFEGRWEKHGGLWTEGEDARLLALHRSGKAIEEIITHIDRSFGAVERRLVLLGETLNRHISHGERLFVRREEKNTIKTLAAASRVTSRIERRRHEFILEKFEQFERRDERRQLRLEESSIADRLDAQAKMMARIMRRASRSIVKDFERAEWLEEKMRERQARESARAEWLEEKTLWEELERAARIGARLSRREAKETIDAFMRQDRRIQRMEQRDKKFQEYVEQRDLRHRLRQQMRQDRECESMALWQRRAESKRQKDELINFLYDEGMTLDEIAEHIERVPNTVAKRLIQTSGSFSARPRNRFVVGRRRTLV